MIKRISEVPGKSFAATVVSGESSFQTIVPGLQEFFGKPML